MHRLWLIVHEPLDAFIVQGGAEVPALVCGSILLALAVLGLTLPLARLGLPPGWGTFCLACAFAFAFAAARV